jgi:putative tricarboxylic transport membrane protein
MRIIAPGPAGGGWHDMACAVGRGLVECGFATDAAIDVVPGRGGTVGLAQFVERHRGDPSALLVSGNVMLGAIIGHNSAVSIADTRPIARLTGEWEAFGVAAGSPIRDLDGLLRAIADEREPPVWAVGSIGSVGQVAVGLICRALGLEPRTARFKHYPSGGDAVRAVTRGEATAVVNGYRELLHPAEAGLLRILGVAADKPIAQVDAPTLGESGVDVQSMNWRMICAAPDIPAAAEADISAAIAKMATSKSWTDELHELGVDDNFLSGEPFRRFLAAEIDATTSILRGMGVG